MKTDDLIDVLSTDLEAADRGRVWRALVAAFAIGAVVAFAAMLVVLGARADPIDGAHGRFILMKLFFTLSVIALATLLLVKCARPMAERYNAIFLLAVPFVAIAIAAILALGFAHWTAWDTMILGKEWLTCLISIPVFAVVPYAALVWALRTAGAPTNLVRTGAIAGLLAGGIGATAYAFHCPDDSLPFVAVWYGMTIGLCTFIGAKTGPWLLRW